MTIPLKPEAARVVTTVVPEGDSAGLVELIRFLMRHWRSVGLACLVGGAVAALWAVVLTPREFQASATMVVMPPRISSDLQPGLMSIQGVQRLLESDAVIEETIRHLVDDGVLRARDPLPERGDQLRSRIYTSRRQEGQELAPVIELVALAETAEAAAATANTWAGMLLESLKDLKGQSTTDNIELVETQYEMSRKTVESLDEVRLDAAEGFSSQLAEATIRWRREIDRAQLEFERQLVDLRTAGEDARVAYQLETRTELERLVRDHGFPMVADAAGDPGDSAESLTGFDSEVLVWLREIMRLRIQLAQTTEFVTLQKTISNDAIWQATILDQAEVLSLEALPSVQLLDQEINRTYSQLTERLSETDSKLESRLTDANRLAVRRVTADLEEMQRRRSAGLTKLIARQALEVEELQTEGARKLEALRVERDRELQGLERRQTTRLLHLEQVASDARTHFSELAAKYRQAELARGEQQLADVRLAARAVPPREPRSRRLALKVLLGMFFGGLLGVSVTFVREIGAR